MKKRKCEKCDKQTIPGLSRPLCQYHYSQVVFGTKWADRCSIGNTPPDSEMKERGCDECCEYGCPGWVIEGDKWVRCNCNKGD